MNRAPPQTAAPAIPDTATADVFLGGAITVFQPKVGFRAGTDSVLLAAALDPSFKGACLELGCGAGGALLPAAWRLSAAQFTGLERDQDMAALARLGVEANGFSGRVDIVEGDVAALPKSWAERFDLVFSNPPFFRPGSIAKPGSGKSDAYIESLPIGDWIGTMLAAVKRKGTIVLIHRAAELMEILAALDGHVGEVAVLPVRSCSGADAKRVIIRARKGLRAGPMRLLAGIDLYDYAGGPRSAQALAISAEGASVDW